MKLVDQVRAARADQIPAGWLTQLELAKAEGYESIRSSGGFHYVIRDAVETGLLEAREFRVATASGIRRVRHYRYTKKAKQG